MKIIIQKYSWRNNYLAIEWDVPHLPRIGESIRISDFLSAEVIAMLKNTPPEDYGYYNEYRSAYEGMADELSSNIHHVEWYKDKQGTTTMVLLME